MANVLIATIGWGVVQDSSGNVLANQAYTLTHLDDSAVASGFTNSKGEIPGSIASGVYKLTIAGGPVRIVHAIAYDDIVATTDSRLPTQGENDALIGTSGTPASGNRYVTDLDPRVASIPSATQKAGLAGTSGTPSDTNRYVTNSDTRLLGVQAIPFSAVQVKDVGELNQIRAGRQFALTDVTGLGITAPVAGYNCSDLLDWSGNNRTLINKGGVTLGVGINGIANTAFALPGSVTNSYYLPDDASGNQAGAAFRLRTTTIECWFRADKRGQAHSLVTKMGIASGNWAWQLSVNTSNHLQAFIYGSDGATVLANAIGVIDVVDGRWHHGAMTWDGYRLMVYTDGVLEAWAYYTGAAVAVAFTGAAPLNIGSYGADATNNAVAGSPLFGAIDEIIIAADVYSPEHIHNHYCASATHTLGQVPTHGRMRVTRQRRGRPLTSADFPAPSSNLFRKYEMDGQLNTGVAQTGDIVGLSTGTGFITAVTGVDGRKDHAYLLSGAHGSISASDELLPQGTNSRTYAIWFKTMIQTTQMGLIGWGTAGTGDTNLMISATGVAQAVNAADTLNSGIFVCDGQWHWAAVVENNSDALSQRRKIYVDGRFVAASSVFTSVVNIGPGTPSGLRIGKKAGNTLPYTGVVDQAWIYNGALTQANLMSIYNAVAQQLPSSPKDSADHIESFSSAGMLSTFDTLDYNDLVDLQVVA